ADIKMQKSGEEGGRVAASNRTDHFLHDIPLILFFSRRSGSYRFRRSPERRFFHRPDGLYFRRFRWRPPPSDTPPLPPPGSASPWPRDRSSPCRPESLFASLFPAPETSSWQKFPPLPDFSKSPLPARGG